MDTCTSQPTSIKVYFRGERVSDFRNPKSRPVTWSPCPTTPRTQTMFCVATREGPRPSPREVRTQVITPPRLWELTHRTLRLSTYYPWSRNPLRRGPLPPVTPVVTRRPVPPWLTAKFVTFVLVLRPRELLCDGNKREITVSLGPSTDLLLPRMLCLPSVGVLSGPARGSLTPWKDPSSPPR